MKKLFQKNQKGFTLLETFVALFIFSLTLAGFLMVTTRGIFSTRNAIHETIASNLAQEGLELVERKRGYNFLNINNPSLPGDWISGLFPVCENGCAIGVESDITSASQYAQSCPVSGCEGVFLNDNRYVNSQETGSEATPYTRTIYVEKFGVNFEGRDDAVRVISEVAWMSGGSKRTVLYEKTLTNWYAP